MKYQFISLSEVTSKIGSGATPRGGKSSYKKDGISLIRSLNVYDFAFKYSNLAKIDNKQAAKLKNVVVESGDVLINITGASVCRCTMVPEQILPARVNQHVSIIRPIPAILNSRYLLYVINSTHFKESLFNLAYTGATREALTKGDLENFKIPLPPLPIQRKIAAVLSAYDDLIENNNRRIAILEKMAEELYREWFVRFRFPGHEQCKMVQGVPEGWEVKKIGDVAKFKYGYTESAINDNSFPKFIRVTDINKKSYIDYSRVPNCKIDECDLEKYKLSKYDIVIARMADPGKVAIVEVEKKIVFASYLIKIDYNRRDVQPYYFFYLLSAKNLVEHFTNSNSSSTRASINGKTIGMTIIVVPEIKLQKSFDEKIFLLRKELNLYLKKNNSLRKIRDRLLSRLMSGKIDLEQLDIRFPQSMLDETPVKEDETDV